MVLIMDERDKRRVESVARGDGRVRCQECDEPKALESDGRAVRYKGDIRYWLVCKNGHSTDMLVSEDGARQLGLPVPAYRRRA